MFQEQETPELDTRDAIIMEVIDQCLEGISFNKLAANVAKHMSKVTLTNRIKKLKRTELIVETCDPSHRQKKVYKSTGSMKEIVGILGQLDEWARSQEDKLSKLESRLASDPYIDKIDIDIIKGLAEILSEIGLPMLYVLQIRLRYDLKSAMLIVPRAIMAASTILEIVMKLLRSYPDIADNISSIVAKQGINIELIGHVSRRYLNTFEGKVFLKNW